MVIKSLKLQITSEDLLAMVSRHAKCLKGICINSIILDYGCAFIDGSFSNKMVSNVEWTAKVSLKHNFSTLGFCIEDLSVKGWKTVLLSLASVLDSREKWVANLIAGALCKLSRSKGCDPFAYSARDVIWIDIEKMIKLFGVAIAGTITGFEIDKFEIDKSEIELSISEIALSISPISESNSKHSLEACSSLESLVRFSLKNILNRS